jgi:hypothetical protein
MSEEFLAVSFGGGRNGAMLIGMYERGIRPNVITFANTGRVDRSHGEKRRTYQHVDLMSQWCEEKFGIPITEVHKTSIYGSLYDNCMAKNMLPSIAYGFHSCADKWKVQPQDKWFNNYGPAREIWARREQIVKAIGYDAGEPQRAEKRARTAENATDDWEKYKYWYPLIEWGWFLEDCKSAYSRHGLPVPSKSACFYCPSSTKAEVIALSKNDPEQFAQAVAMERNAAPNLKTVKGLGRHWSWEGLVQISELQMQLLPEAPQMACACFDSDN